ncbi:MAG: hypothetical protein A2571_00885 [Candidatus Vogelbacteria bacterium RIFOXYD1_FULL_44_32]|uniref:Uncharacterized protein n=1 Tax=Candidatus Vogelbacteria bacterium RIFOXYD1_FULL_44_32 TaxID=1802438 RepID=A0A1G2QEA2_9BACT|nr:MAG: hypothetical protein A2571_00885 [Candidatus Vogelbacteria bacterium RIFOXYD1_FULL_44_32]
MSFESIPEETSALEQSPFKDVYFQTIKNRVERLQEQGELPEEYVKGVLERAGYVEGPFENEGDAEEKGREFLSAVEPIAEFMRGLNNAETHLLNFSGDINIAMETLETKVDISEEKKIKISDDLQAIRNQVDNYLNKIKAARAQIV